MKRALRTATSGDLPMVWSAVRGTHVFSDRGEMEGFFSEAPWRFQVTDAGEAAVLERWRQHLEIVSVRGLWCAERRIADIIRGLDAVGTAQGFSDLLSPVVPESRMQPYADAGMGVCQRIVSMRLDKPGKVKMFPVRTPEGVSLRLGDPGDEAAVLAVDIQAFEPFWRGDPATVRRYLTSGRVMLAEAEGTVIGYTFSTADRGEGILGRLAVIPARRECGIGTLLLHDALEYLSRLGASGVSLCTQEGNATSRSLYARAGFREVGETSVLLAFGRTPDTHVG